VNPHKNKERLENAAMTNDDENNKRAQELGRAEMVYNIIKARYDLAWKNKCILDEKASRIIGFVGILITLYVGVSNFTLKNISKDDEINLYINIRPYYILLFIFLLGVISLLCSLLIALRAYSIKKWLVNPNPNAFLNNYADCESKSEVEILGTLSRTTANDIEQNETTNDERGRYITWAIYTLVSGIFLSVAFVVIAIWVNG
jgi:disulfide bond formation protein DsbB